MRSTAFDDPSITRGVMVVEGEHLSQTTIARTFVRPFSHSPFGELPPNGWHIAWDRMDIIRFDEDGRPAEEWTVSTSTR